MAVSHAIIVNTDLVLDPCGEYFVCFPAREIRLARINLHKITTIATSFRVCFIALSECFLVTVFWHGATLLLGV